MEWLILLAQDGANLTQWPWWAEILKSVGLLCGGTTIGVLGKSAFVYLASRGKQEVEQDQALDAQALALIERYGTRIGVLEAQHEECEKSKQALMLKAIEDAGKIGRMEAELGWLRDRVGKVEGSVHVCDTKIAKLETAVPLKAAEES